MGFAILNSLAFIQLLRINYCFSLILNTNWINFVLLQYAIYKSNQHRSLEKA